MLRKLFLIILVITFVSACAERKIYFNVKQPLDIPLEASIGMVVLRIDKKINLKNIFGKSDIFGRTTTLDFNEVIFLGVNRDRKPKFRLTNKTRKVEFVLDYPTENIITFLNTTIEVRCVSSVRISYFLRKKNFNN